MSLGQPSVDFRKILRRIKNYDDVVGGHEPLEIETVDDVSDVMMDLMAGMAERNVELEKCVFWMNPETSYTLRKDMEYIPRQEGFRGRPIRIDETVPKDHILFAAPDALSLDGKVYNPLAVGYAQVHEIHPDDKDEFDEKWEQYQEMADDIDEAFNLPSRDNEQSRKERIRELWADGKVRFIANVPVVLSEGLQE